ncbi:MAG: efflux RND transporter periplasmic adaptor subunit [Planctomycetes bacterium]|nr:efflux RND transporter periplasmic adaptor subunit [Planctomycetota bacterium]
MRLSVFAVLTAGCGYKPSPAESKPEEKSAQVTVWGDRFEIFLEHKLIVAGQPVTFVTHVSDLKTLHPRKEGPIVFVLRQGTEPPIEHVDPAPARAGIYTPKLAFPKAGSWSVTLRIPIDGQEQVVELPSFTVYGSKEEVDRAPEPEAPEGISFLKEQQWRLLTRVEPVVRRKLTQRIKVPALVAARPGSRAAVTPPVAGRLLAPPGKSLPEIGRRVEAGQTLAIVQPPFSDFAAKLVESEAAVIRAKLDLDQADLVHGRIKELVGKKAKSERELQEAEFAQKTTKASYDAAVALRDTYRKSGAIVVDGLPVLELRAPIAGTLVRVHAATGEHVSTERSVFEILDSGTVWIDARVPESDLARVSRSFGASYETPEARGTFVDIPGTARFVGTEVDPPSRTVSILYEAENPGGHLRVGMALTVHLETARAEDASAIPTSAVVDEEGRPVVFVQLSGETFEKRYIQLGIRSLGYVQVLEGLADGDRVVTKEAYSVRLASVSTTIPAHGHAH